MVVLKIALEELKLLTKLEELDQYSHGALHQFPKCEKYVLAMQMRQTLAGLIRQTIRCAKRFHKKTSRESITSAIWMISFCSGPQKSISGIPCLTFVGSLSVI